MTIERNNSFPVMAPYKRHVLVCTGTKCAPAVSSELYRYLKERLRQTGLHEGENRVLRSQCHCLGVCEKGPIAVVYPEGVWYHSLNKEKVETIIESHFFNGRPVSEYIFYPS